MTSPTPPPEPNMVPPRATPNSPLSGAVVFGDQPLVGIKGLPPTAVPMRRPISPHPLIPNVRPTTGTPGREKGNRQPRGGRGGSRKRSGSGVMLTLGSVVGLPFDVHGAADKNGGVEGKSVSESAALGLVSFTLPVKSRAATGQCRSVEPIDPTQCTPHQLFCRCLDPVLVVQVPVPSLCPWFSSLFHHFENGIQLSFWFQSSSTRI
jgi:hypothetical protein